MKTRLSIAGTIAALVVTLAPAAEGATLQQRVKKLERKVRTLQALTTNLSSRLFAAERVNANLLARMPAVEGVTSCIAAAVPLTSYGDPGGTFGYVYDPNDGTGEFLTSGVDFPYPGEVPQAWVAGLKTSCAPATARPARPANGTAPSFKAFVRPAPMMRARGM